MGGDHHGHHHGPPYKIPDYRIYKVEEVPELMQLKRILTKEGLKDPWLRNEVWRFQMCGNARTRFHHTFLRGVKYGFIACVITVALETAWEKLNPSDHGHH